MLEVGEKMTGSTNETIRTQLAHRTIREFTQQTVDDDTLRLLLEVANRTASSTCMQSYSIIHVTDDIKRQEIADVCRQSYILRVPVLLIFIVDVYRNARIAAEQNQNLPSSRDMDRFFQGFTDASLAAQNLTLAAESLGLGAFFIGSILNDSDRIISILKLPELTFPVVGIGLGYPAQKPQQKPRMDLALKVYENEYRPLDQYLPAIVEYDQEMQTYYDLRDPGRRVDSFSKQVVARLENPSEKRSKMLRAVQRQGFDLGLPD